jgi:hypothetical protein
MIRAFVSHADRRERSRTRAWRGLAACALGTALVVAQATIRAVPDSPVDLTTHTPCDVPGLARSKAEFLHLSAHDGLAGRRHPEALRRASAEFILRSEACYQDLYGGTDPIDEGGLWFGPEGSRSFVTFGTKWGTGSPFAAGHEVPGPRSGGVVVTYSYMSSGVSASAEGASPIVAVTSLATFEPCFLTEIAGAFAAWARVANIRFVEVADSGAPFNAPGAAGDIRIGAHAMNGPGGVLAHAFFPPPNGVSAAGDVHFDASEHWSCSTGPGVIDIGIVAAHEVGHSIGLDHEPITLALMNAFYNPAVSLPNVDDIRGASSIYGPPLSTASRAGDFDGDGRSDATVFRPASGRWYVLRSSTGYSSYSEYQWGTSSDIPVPADYDGDGITDVAAYQSQEGLWLIRLSSTGFTGIAAYQWGRTTDVPVPGDYDGDGRADLAVFRPPTGFWYIRLSSVDFTAFVGYQWGYGTDLPVPGDYDGDGRTDPAVFRPADGMWHQLLSTTGHTAYASHQWGYGTDLPMPGDYDGDGRTDPAVFRPADGMWHLLLSTTGHTAYSSHQWGDGTDIPVPGDYDGDGRTDVAVYRPGTGHWLALHSSTGGEAYVSYQWGAPYDVPVLRRRWSLP